MSAARPSTLMLKSGRLSVGAARLAVRQVTRARPAAAGARPMQSARVPLPFGAKNTATVVVAANAGPSQIADSLGNSN
jgi:hypothetical protein